MRLPSKVTPYKDSILAKFPIVLAALQTKNLTPSELYKKVKGINGMMYELNYIIYDGKKTAPTLTIQDASHYIFFTPKDSGTGSKYKGLMVFDLAMLKMTALPVLAHDSLLLKQIEDGALEKILELYTQTPKQVFITLDKEGTYTERAQEIMKTTEVLRLYPGGGELFGWSWNENTEERK